jgi:TPR repeat protein
VNRPRSIRRFPLPRLALLSVALSAASIAPGQDTNPSTVAAGGNSNVQQEFTLSSSNSISFLVKTDQERLTAEAGAKAAAEAKALEAARLKAGQERLAAEAKAREEARLKAKQQQTLRSVLAWMDKLARGVPQDFATAVNWHHKAAEQGNADAQYNLGLFCRIILLVLLVSVFWMVRKSPPEKGSIIPPVESAETAVRVQIVKDAKHNQ